MSSDIEKFEVSYRIYVKGVLSYQERIVDLLIVKSYNLKSQRFLGNRFRHHHIVTLQQNHNV